ncbi:DUF3373 family protein [Sulfurovum mangrovi]|uniref:DUF3373 family protein n=1 Tax=Sulfurovum mangrovi TaxID=2893889 RepID=UPI001E5B44D0|nr:DUF3373 family protein [Sulfurovum mangrovi]UFH60219.1 DUF3373 domain-containing protein [Sulfurovum mangrovi]
MNKLIGMSLVATLAMTSMNAATVEELEARIAKLEKKVKKNNKTIVEVKKHDAFDNIKFGVDFRNAVDSLSYKDNETGEKVDNNSLLTSRLYLTMAAAPTEGLIFKGKLAIYSTWGAHLYDESAGLKDWSASSKATDTLMRVKEAYFVYSTEVGEQPVSFSIGRRPSTNGFLANYRENEPDAGSPLAHITNMEVNGAMVKLDWGRYIEGAYTKFVYGRAHTGEVEGVYGKTTDGRFPYADIDSDAEDENVDFLVVVGDAYYNGQYKLMYQWAHIFNTKGINLDTDVTKVDAGSADLLSLGLQVSGIGDGISDFLDDTMVFVSGAYSYYDAKDGYQLLGSEDGGSQDGYSIWAGVVIPDMITESGKFGFEYNHGSKYWTPMTWAEDTAIGSKIAVRGDAYEAYWNFNLFGIEYLPSQVRYTYAQHDYTPNINCAGWVDSDPVDITAQDLRFSVSYRY